MSFKTQVNICIALFVPYNIMALFLAIGFVMKFTLGIIGLNIFTLSCFAKDALILERGKLELNKPGSEFSSFSFQDASTGVENNKITDGIAGFAAGLIGFIFLDKIKTIKEKPKSSTDLIFEKQK